VETQAFLLTLLEAMTKVTEVVTND
jgi:hypothetical protein